MSALERLAGRLAERDVDGLRRVRWTTSGACGPRQMATPADAVDRPRAPRPLLSFCSNDYLGLASHPTVVAALAEGARLHGAGSGASPLISGHGSAHASLEADVARFMSPVVPSAAALHFGTGYLANLAVVTALGAADTTLYCDALNHASLIDGARLARAAVVVYPHGDVATLDDRLATCATPGKVIVTDGVFSMDGDIAPLAALLRLAERHDAWLVVDDAHGFGVLGTGGRGSLALAGLCSERLVAIGTFGKAAGVAGAFVAAHPLVVDWLVQTGRSYIYSTAAPPALAQAVAASVALIAGPEGDERRRHLAELTARLRAAIAPCLDAAGWRLLPSITPIQPIVVGTSAAAMSVAAALDADGIRVPAIRPPTVADGTARLRIGLSAAHGFDDIDRLAAALRRAAARR